MTTYRCPKCDQSDRDPAFHRNGCPGSPEGVLFDERVSALEDEIEKLKAALEDVDSEFKGLRRRVQNLEILSGKA
jgi:hypothetical protein